jgi:hypothetical protein
MFVSFAIAERKNKPSLAPALDALGVLLTVLEEGVDRSL